MNFFIPAAAKIDLIYLKFIYYLKLQKISTTFPLESPSPEAALVY
jgi:hypothetical protein